MNSTVQGPDGELRCSWCSAAPEFFEYHDNEWGYPVYDDIRLFEKAGLEVRWPHDRLCFHAGNGARQ